MLLWTILVVFGVFGSAYSESKICITPDGHAGTCVDVRTCAPLLPLLTHKPIPEKDLTFLRQSKCYGPFPYGVCCKIQTDTPSAEGSSPPQAQLSSPTLSDGQPAGPALSVEEAPDFSLFIDDTPDPTTLCTSDHGFEDPSSCCGVDVKSNRGTGVGNKASLEQHPWLALIEYRRNNTVQMLCGGVLVSSQYVLTAAHCVTDAVLKVSTPVSVRLGEYDTSSLLDCVTEDAGATRCADAISVIPIEKTIAHPLYDAVKRRDDIALVKLSTKAPYTDYIRPICLPSPHTPLDASSELRAAGWGIAATRSAVKQNVRLPYVNGTACQQFYYAPRSVIQLWEKQMCAGTHHSKDSCASNSGGPLLLNSVGYDRFEVVGVASFGPRSCGIDVYTKVSEYVDWIRGEVKI